MSRRDAQLQALVAQQPDDADAILVYADWLEEQGDVPRSTFLRMQQQLRAMKVSHPKLLLNGRALFELGKTLPPDWVAAVTSPKLAGTAWDGRDDHGPLVWRFLANGFINYTQGTGTYENGRWEQVGLAVAIDTNAHYADYFGVIVGDVIRGEGRNVVDHEWRWKVTRTSDPEVARVPEHVTRKVYDGNLRVGAKPKAAGPKPKAKSSSRPLLRKTPLKRRTPLRTVKR